MNRQRFAVGLMLLAAMGLVGPASFAQEKPTEQGQQQRQVKAQAKRRGGPAAMPARLQVAVFELRMAVEKGSAFDVDALSAEPCSVGDLYGRLKKLGEVTLRYRFDQCVDLLGKASVGTGAAEPYVRVVSGQPPKSTPKVVDYLETGCEVEIRFAGYPEPRRPEVPCCAVQVKLAGLQSLSAPVGLEGNLYRESEKNLRYVGTPVAGRPQIIYCMEAAPAGDPTEALVYLARIAIQPMQKTK